MFALALKLAILVLVSQQDIGCHAQLSFHTDANTNSFTLKTPGLQQSFTRYYGSGTSQPLAETPTPAPAQAPALAPAAAQIPFQSQQLAQQDPLQTTSSFAGGFGPSSLQYPGAYQQAAAVSGKQKAAAALAPQQSQQFIGQPPLATNPPILGGPVGVGVASMPSYADQMHAAFIDYQRQRIEFEQQQQHLLQKLYHYYPDVSGSLPPSQIQAQPSEGGLPLSSPSLAGAPAAVASGTALGFGAGSGSRGSAGVTSSRFAYRRPHFSSNGLQPGAERGSVAAATAGSGSPSSNFGFSTGSSQQRIPGSVGDFYSTQQHMGFMQQQQQDVLRDQQQSVAHQFATSQLAPTTRQSYGMAVPMSSVLGTPSFQPSADVSHVSFSSGNLNYSF